MSVSLLQLSKGKNTWMVAAYFQKGYEEDRSSIEQIPENWDFQKLDKITKNAAGSLQRNFKKTCKRQQPRKVWNDLKVYYRCVRSKHTLKGAIATISLENESIFDIAKGKAKCLKDYFSSVHWQDKGFPVTPIEPYNAEEILQLMIIKNVVLKVLRDKKTGHSLWPW